MANSATLNRKGRPASLRGIVFDLDGTLVDSLSFSFEAFNHAVVAQGGRPRTREEILRYFGMGEDKIFARLLKSEEKGARAYELCREYTDRNLHRVPLHEGVGTLLESLRRAEVPIAICTGRSWSTTELILRHHGLLERFVTVIADDHVGSPKPSPEGLHLALSRMGVPPAQALFVGDSPADMQAARAAGAQGVAALWDPLASRERLGAHSPRHWAERPGHVWEIWRGR